MAKKKIDLWAGTQAYSKPEVSSTNDASDFLNKNSKSKSKKSKGKSSKNDSHLTPGDGHDPKLDERKIKNPLHVIEGKDQLDTNVSTAVSAALAKAIQEDYEIGKLGEILDVVIDEVDDPDLSNESLRRKNFGIVPIFLIIGSIILAIILVPLVLMLGYSINKVSDITAAREIMGYKTDIEGEPTRFAIMTEDGRYVSTPLDEFGRPAINQPIEVVDGFDTDLQEMYFHIEENKYGTTFQISHDAPSTREAVIDGKSTSGQTYSIINNDGSIEWMDSEYNAQSGIYLVKKIKDEQKFAIGFDNTNKFVSISDEDTLELSNDPEYFTLIADVKPIISGEQYLEDYNYLSEGTDRFISGLDIGPIGNPVALYSNSSHKYLSGYRNVDYEEIPFVDIDETNTYYNAEEFFVLSNTPQYDFFLNPVEGYNAASGMVDTYLTIGAYQTTAFDWSLIPFVDSSNGAPEGGYDSSDSFFARKVTTQYPLLTASNGELYFQQYESAYQNYETLPDGSVITDNLTLYPETRILLFPDPTNLNRKAIYFVQEQKFLSTVDGIHLQEINSREELLDLDYFTFVHSKRRNPENISSKVDSLTTDSGVFTLYANNYSNLDGFELKLWGYEANHWFEIMGTIGDILNNPILNQPGNIEARNAWIKYVLSFTTDTYYKAQDTGKNSHPIELTNLEFNTWYIGYVNVFRDDYKDVGKHSTSLPVIFKTANNQGNVNNWGDGTPIPIDMPSGGNPTDPSVVDTPSTVSNIRNTSPEVNSDSVNYRPGGETSTMDIKPEEMRDLAPKALDISVDLVNGEVSGDESGITSGLKVELYEYDPSETYGNLISEQVITTDDKLEGLEDGTYTALFRGLSPETTYIPKVYVKDLEDVWYEIYQSSPSIVTMSTEREVPSYINEKLDVRFNISGNGEIMDLSNLETNKFQKDTIKFDFVSADGRNLSTGWQQISSYKSGVMANGEILVTITPYELNEGVYLTMGGPASNPSSILGNEYTFTATMKVEAGDYTQWPSSSPIWGELGQGEFELFRGTLRVAT